MGHRQYSFPKVATEQGWHREEMLDNLAASKARIEQGLLGKMGMSTFNLPGRCVQ